VKSKELKTSFGTSSFDLLRKTLKTLQKETSHLDRNSMKEVKKIVLKFSNKLHK
jgi:hypothetical protein